MIATKKRRPAGKTGRQRSNSKSRVSRTPAKSRESIPAPVKDPRDELDGCEVLTLFDDIFNPPEPPRFQARNRKLANAATEFLIGENPMTLRQLFYRCVSAGDLSATAAEYKRLGRVMTVLRESREIPRTWIVDHLRQTLKPSSWTGLVDFSETVRDAYRKDLWAEQTVHVAVLVEKDAVAATVQTTTEKYDVALHVCRGYASISFAGEIADVWRRIDKPIHAYYCGDFDPSGFDIERDLRKKLAQYSDREFSWHRLAVVASDFDEHDLLRLPVKTSDMRSAAFIEAHGEDCAELDAIPPTVLRERVQGAIDGHIDHAQWERLQKIEKVERESMREVLGGLNGKLDLDLLSGKRGAE